MSTKIPTKSSAATGENNNFQIIESRSPRGEEIKTAEIGKSISGCSIEETTKTIPIPLNEIRSPSPGEKSEVEMTELVFQAIESIETADTPFRSFHEKWASPQFKEIIEDWSVDFVERIGTARMRISGVKEMYHRILSESPPSSMQSEVAKLMELGNIQPIAGGKGGVYLLCDETDRPRFIIKPGDESNLALNNGKKFASPFLDDENVSPVQGVRIYEAVQNMELSYLAAEIFGLQEITPKTEVMILEYSGFHSLLEGTLEKNTPPFQHMEEKSPDSKEKACSVQVYFEGCRDIGTILCTQSNLEPEEIKKLMMDEPEKYDELEKTHTPHDFDHEFYERIAIFSFIIGEKDGNAGNLMCTETTYEEEKRPIFKIDNAATFPEMNDGLRTGLCWVVHNYTKELSPKIRHFIQEINDMQIEKLKNLMRLRGKSENSISAMEERIKYLKIHEKISETVEDLDDSLIQEFSPDESSTDED